MTAWTGQGGREREGTSMERGGQREDGGSLPRPWSCMLPFCYSWLHGEVKSPKVNGAFVFHFRMPFSLSSLPPSLSTLAFSNNNLPKGPLHYFWTHTLHSVLCKHEQSTQLDSCSYSLLSLSLSLPVTRPGPGDQAGDRACIGSSSTYLGYVLLDEMALATRVFPADSFIYFGYYIFYLALVQRSIDRAMYL